MNRTVLAGLLFCALVLPSNAKSQTSDLEGNVTSVTDGDTLKVSAGKKIYKIRFYAVDAPEIGRVAKPDQPCLDAQPYACKAKDFISRRASGHQVNVQVSDIDKYGRTVGTILLEDGSNLNEELVKAGLGWWYAKYSPTLTRMARYEAEARHQRLGLFRDPDPLPPWIFRHPETRADWDRNKCILQSHGCSGGGEATTCQFRDSKNEAVFDADGTNECVARKLIEYQLCRGERTFEPEAIDCTPYNGDGKPLGSS
jgi:micrococcal nuclease